MWAEEEEERRSKYYINLINLLQQAEEPERELALPLGRFLS